MAQMQMIRIIIILFCLALTASSAARAQDFYTTEQIRAEYAQPPGERKVSSSSGSVTGENDTMVGPGMEVRDVGGVRVIVPQGAKVYREGSQVIFEDTGEYLARRFAMLEDEIAYLKEDLLRKERAIEGLKKEVARMQETLYLEGGTE